MAVVKYDVIVRVGTLGSSTFSVGSWACGAFSIKIAHER